MHQTNQVSLSKTKWITPELIILVRNSPEESVLTVCKSEPPQTGYGAVHYMCHFIAPTCFLCEAQVGS